MNKERLTTKTLYWSSLAFTHLSEMRVLHSSKLLHKIKTTPVTGKLQKKDGSYVRDEVSFRNVVEHSLIQVAAHHILGQVDGSTTEEIDIQKRTALVHDADIRIDKRPQDFSPQDLERYRKLREKVNPNKDFIRAESGSPNHIDVLVNKKKLDYQTLKAWYVDNIAGKSENPKNGNHEEDIVSINQRIDELKVRKPVEGKNIPVEIITMMEDTLQKDYGWNEPYDYWEVERMFMKIVEKEIFNRLVENGVKIDQPSEIPAFIKSEIEKQYSSS